MEEGCLSIPEVRDHIERSEKVKFKFKNADFQDVSLEASGLVARVILHEIDHLNGILFIDHLTSAKKKLHAPRLRMIQKGDFEVSYPVATAAEVASDADALILVTEWPEYQELDWAKLAANMRTKVLLDGRNLLDRERLNQAGFKYLSMAG